MKDVLNISDAERYFTLPNGDHIILIDRLGQEGQFTTQEKARNVFLIDAKGHVKWQIQSQFDNDGGPFTQIRLENGLTAYRWDGVAYGVDMDTGLASPLLLER